MRERFRHVDFRDRSAELISRCNGIVDEYLGQGLRLTLRQLYYQLVSRNVIANREREYKNLSSLVSNGRLAGLIDWDAIEDRIRQPRSHPQFDDLRDLVRAALHSYRLPRWDGQEQYVELWVEKDALAGVLEPLSREHHVTLMVNRGYSSQSAMYESAKRFLASGKSGILFYLGDLDPSGEDMVRDIQDRLDMFGAEVEVRKLALTPEQVAEHDPPPNPAKMTDPRAEAYVREHGDQSWEVDALPPDVLAGIIRAAFAAVIDEERMQEVRQQEERDKADLTRAVASILRRREGES
jgi:hypothetical protein